MTNKGKLNVGVLCGGFSGEREVSLRSGDSVLQYLSPEKYLASRIDVISEKEWHRYDTDGTKRILDLDQERDREYLKTFDVLFNALHGTFGEDGQIQALLDTLGVRYTGSGSKASALAIDKVKTMEYVASAGMLVPEFFRVGKETPAKETMQNIEHRFGYPAIVKPNDSGSTLGLSLVQKKEDLIAALEKASGFCQEIIVQRYIFGREFTCGVLGNASDEDPVLLPPVEIIIRNQIFDFNDKYFSKETQELCPAPIDEHLTKNIQKLALQAHRLLGCDGLSRSDFRMNVAGEIFFLETNTSPGMTEASLCPKEALVYGMDMSQFLDRIISVTLFGVRTSV